MGQLWRFRDIILDRPVQSCSFLIVCRTTGPKPLPKRALHIVRSRAYSFKWEHPLLSLRSSSNFLRILPRLPFTSIPPFIFPSITCSRRQFLRKMWPIQFAFRLLISPRIFLCSLTLCNTHFFIFHMIGTTDILHPSPAPHFKTFHVFLIYRSCIMINLLATWNKSFIERPVLTQNAEIFSSL